MLYPINYKMDFTIFIALMAMIFLALNDLLYKIAKDKGATVGSFLFTQACFFGVTTIVFAVLTGGIYINTIILKYASLSGILMFIAYMCFLKGLEGGNVSINSTIFRLNFILTGVFAILFLNESLPLIKITGFAFAVLTIMSFTLQRDNKLVSSSVIYSVLAMFLFGTAMFIWKIGIMQGASPINYTIVQFLSFSILAFIFLKTSEKKLNLSKSIIQYAPFCGFLQATANILTLKSLESSEVSIVIPIVQLSFVITAFMAILVLKEQLTIRKLIGLFFAVFAVLAFNSAFTQIR